MFFRVNVFTTIATTLLLILGLSADGQTVAPVLTPYTVTAIAGNTQSSVAGYGGEGVPGLSATLNNPNALAVDSVGNVYIADQSNALIREWNPRTNIIKTIAGVAPSSCSGTTCTTINSGCSDGVPAYGNPVGSRMQGLVVDGFGNIYFSDYNYQGVWVIYRAGEQVANFIALVDKATVSSASEVQPGYIYHIAGSATPKAGGCTTAQGTTDNVLATSATFHDPLQMGIDAAGNLYVQDYANNVVRAINTQATSQTILGVTVKPGYVAAVVGCNATMTVACPTSVPAWGSSAQGAWYNVQVGMTTDQYGNVYQVNGKGATGGIYGGVAYAGGDVLSHLLNLESGLTPKVGGWYEVINNLSVSYQTGYDNTVTPIKSIALEPAIPANAAFNIVLRPNSIAVDPLGNVYMYDYHWLTIYRVDANSQMASRLMPGLGNTTLVAPAGTNAAPAYCSGTSGPQTKDAYGDGCSLQQAKISTANSSGYITFDGAGNLYFSDPAGNLVRKASIGTQFAATNIGSSLTQTLQMHFDEKNLPAANDATSFKIVGETADFTVGNVSCSNFTIRDTSIECYVTIAFTPTAVGTRNATLQAKAASGTYDFALTGVGGGPQIAVDGGGSTTVPVTGLGNTTSVAIDSLGNVYAADPTNNRITVTPAGGGTTTTVGSGFNSPKGVAVDAVGNVYVSDTGNNRVVKVDVGTGTQTVLSTDLNSSTKLSGPQGIAVDATGNVYVADTGNARVVEISPFGELAPVPMLDFFSDSRTFVTPVGIALDTTGNIYVADSGNSSGIIKIAPGGGDLQIPDGGTGVASPTSLVNFGTATIKEPSGVALDAAGNMYVTDAASNTVYELPAGGGPGSEPITLGFTGLSSPGGLALDSNSNVYVADTGNSRVVYVNRTQVPVDFGTVPRFQPVSTAALNVTNIGTSPIAPSSPFAVLSGDTVDFSETDACAASNFSLATLGSGLHCALSVNFQPSANGAFASSVSVQGGAANLSVTGSGENPEAALSLVLTSPADGTLVEGGSATLTLTATQPNGPNPPSGTVTFNYTMNGVAQTPVTENLTTSSSSSTTTFTLDNLLPGRTYVINAVYNGDADTTATKAAPLTLAVPGVAPLTVVANSVSMNYGGTVPALTGTLTGILPADQAGITVTFTTSATPSSPIGTYAITAVLTGGNAANYRVPAAVTSTGAPAVVTVNPAPLTVVVPNWNRSYGEGNVSYGAVVTGLVNGDAPTISYTPADSNEQPVGTYTIVPAVTIGNDTSNYNIKITDGTLVVAKTTPVITVTQAATSVLPTALSGGAITITVAPPTGYYGIPSGTLTMTDTFTPITSTGTGTPVTNAPITLTLTPKGTLAEGLGSATYTPTSSTIGTHVYTFSYSGDSNYTVVNTTATPTSLIVDQADFTVTSTTSPILIAPGILPGGDASVAGEQAATPETALVYVAPILGSTATVNLTCTVPASYVTCTVSPASLTLTGKTTLTSTVSVSTPATLPVNYTGSIAKPARDIAFALLPAGLLTLIPLFRRRRKLSQIVLTIAVFGLLFMSSGCTGGNTVKFFTPVPAGPNTVTITGTSGAVSRSFTIPINIQ